MIAIKNMDIPKGCQHCKFFRKLMFGNGLDYGYSCELGAKDFPMPWIRQQEERATDCPLVDLEDVCNLAKSTSNVGNQIRYSEYLRILEKGIGMDAEQKELIFQLKQRIDVLEKENKVLRQIRDVEVLSTEEAAIELGQGTIYATYDWYNTLNQFKNLGLSVCKIKGVKDEQ